MLSVQTPGGLVFGTARRIQGQTLGFEADGRMEPGDEVQWRMELPGLDETAMGTMRIMGGQKDANATVTTWTGAILSISREDAEVFEIWRLGVESGTRAFSYSNKPPTDSWLAATTMAGSTEAERRLALQAEEERKKGRVERAKRLAKNAKMWPDHEDRIGGKSVASGAFRASLSGSVARSTASSVSSTAAPGNRARDQIAAALRPSGAPAVASARTFAPAPVPAAAVPAAPAPLSESTTAPPPWLSPSPSSPPVVPTAAATAPPPWLSPSSPPVVPTAAASAPAPWLSPSPSPPATPAEPVGESPSEAAPPTAPPPAPPAVSLPRRVAETAEFSKVAPTSPSRATAPTVYVDRAMVSVSFADSAAWVAFRPAVLAGRLAVPSPTAPPAGAALSLWIRLPSGVTVQLTGHAVAAPPGQLVVNLNLTVPARQSLEFG